MPAPCPIIRQAKAEGRRTYFTGRPCLRGHLAERRITDRACMECMKTYRRDNIEKSLAREAKWRASNLTIANERSAAWRALYPDRQRQAEKNYRANNPDKRRVSCKAWSAANKDREVEARKRWVSKNLDRLAAKSAARRALKLRATPPWADTDKIAEIYAEAARITRETGIEHHVDHVVPLKGKNVCGLHVHTNLQILAGTANLSKGNRFDADAMAALTTTETARIRLRRAPR